METALEIKQTRNVFTEHSTISDVEINGEFICYFLEDKDRGLKDTMPEKEIVKLKVYGDTCIPYGVYEIVITLSAAFGIWLPLILNTKGFKGIRQHKGNTKVDTLGCQLMGLKKGVDKVSDSTGAFEKLLFIYLNHLTLNTEIAQKMVDLHKLKNKAGQKEFGELLKKHKVEGQKIIIDITQ